MRTITTPPVLIRQLCPWQTSFLCIQRMMHTKQYPYAAFLCQPFEHCENKQLLDRIFALSSCSKALWKPTKHLVLFDEPDICLYSVSSYAIRCTWSLMPLTGTWLHFYPTVVQTKLKWWVIKATCHREQVRPPCFSMTCICTSDQMRAVMLRAGLASEEWMWEVAPLCVQPNATTVIFADSVPRPHQ